VAGVLARPATQGVGSGIDRREARHLVGKPRIAGVQVVRGLSLGDEIGDQVRRNAGGAKHRIAAHDARIADDEAPSSLQLAQRSGQLAARLAQVDLEQAAFQRDDVARRVGQRIEQLAAQFRGDAVGQAALDRERDEGARVEQPGRSAGALAGDGRDPL
jgi:hypothetical protein